MSRKGSTGEARNVGNAPPHSMTNVAGRLAQMSPSATCPRLRASRRIRRLFQASHLGARPPLPMRILRLAKNSSASTLPPSTDSAEGAVSGPSVNCCSASEAKLLKPKWTCRNSRCEGVARGQLSAGSSSRCNESQGVRAGKDSFTLYSLRAGSNRVNVTKLNAIVS